ncbi:DUF1217 domain-containing protein [Amphiplicatus metriothermophilus]|uniref:Flagellar protein n=2 Tax=Amphiplicatus metriothermophilus TaxID=1519374 RepID=A0A239PKK8_9PROT|nr:DUF1217 domain-containing protein [Amphiplicatus metriothermophilus]SNT68336.1 Protein of unknown function [Amphiplicatus metriothermophilus]
MTFLPVVGIGGYAGFRVLEKTAPRQQSALERTPQIQRNIEYFRENIGKALTAEALVQDRRLLTVALGAFGLGEEIDKRAFIRKVLESSTEDSRSLVNRLSDNRYRSLAKAFAYGDGVGAVQVQLPTFVEDVIARYKTQEFERAVGEADPDFRLALTFKREIAEIAAGGKNDRVMWLQALGRLPVRRFLETALAMPKGVSQIDLDKQVELFQNRARQLFGEKSVAALAEPETLEKVIQRFFLFRQIEAGPSLTTPAGVALTLLQNNGLGGVGGANLLLSQA